jgi:hypothetical protein
MIQDNLTGFENPSGFSLPLEYRIQVTTQDMVFHDFLHCKHCLAG